MKLLLSVLAIATIATSANAIRILGLLLEENGLGLIVGSDKDEWGCIPSAGYTWCNETESCLPINQICSNYNLTL